MNYVYWFEDEKLKEALATDEKRERWAEEDAFKNFEIISPTLPKPLMEMNRIGPLRVAPISGEEGSEKHFWMFPLDRSKHKGLLLGPENKVVLIDKNGTFLFEGPWKNVSPELVRLHVEFYVWVELIERTPKAQWSVKKSWYIKAYEYYLKHVRRGR